MAKYTIEGNELEGFNIRVKKYWLLPSKLITVPNCPRVIWSSTTKRGAQAYINILVRRSK